ncbi:MAG: putative membrane protein [Thermodesulfobacterium sp.]|uniref:Membrane protein n=1 Tax=Candidatus Thermodesulfobacterium syntrophicum TaxID=3060442 RepID=A0AAE3P4T2_9BACT|nr:putative membrane protein [Candidatus Thermodesulfobacterium syntrophicum]
MNYLKKSVRIGANYYSEFLQRSNKSGILKTVEALSMIFTETTVRASFKDLVTNVLTLIVVLELIRAFVDYFEYERVRIETVLEVLIAFIIREFMIHLFESTLSGLEVFLWCAGIIIVVFARTLSIIYRPDKVLSKINQSR